MLWRDYFQSFDGSSEPDDTATWLTPLSEYCLIEVNGENALTFLQGQCTCDITRLKGGAFLLGAHCNHKGRMHSSFYAAATSATQVLLRVHESIADTTVANLQKYAAFSRVSVARSSHWLCCSVLGPQAEAHVHKTFGPLADGHFRLHGTDALAARHSAYQFELWCCGEIDESHYQEILALPKQRDSLLFRWLTIRRGVGEIEGAVAETFIPQELNFQLTDGVSFSKGCYTGQEIIARLHYRGQLKKHMYRGQAYSESPLAAGDALYDEAGKAVGTVINTVTLRPEEVLPSAQRTPRHEFLALCDSDTVASKSCHVGPDCAAKIQWLELPYAIS